ncbi:hypothetical protein FHW16_000434 [Phyllobacterium myrsinacearum]|uniref:Uncharacterized protein n=1 Tax=Phyllobacterium myrsinacearum TaxID=28101 RepID=A0A839ECT8_9HYPH|nr:hypothetical protein [Phyllobacterium myrsinacearum]
MAMLVCRGASTRLDGRLSFKISDAVGSLQILHIITSSFTFRNAVKVTLNRAILKFNRKEHKKRLS